MEADPMSIGHARGKALDRARAMRELLELHPAPRVLELGTKRSNPSFPTHHKGWAPHASEYVMSDAELGMDVDVVADAHRLLRVFDTEAFDALVCVSVLEHLARPWVAIKQMAMVLRPGGVMYVATHQTFPLHGYPSDYFRFSTEALGVLAENAGLRVLDSGYTYPCSITPPREVTRWNPHAQCYLNVDALMERPQEEAPS